MAKENKSRYALLGMLTLGPASGYQIKKLMGESTANFWSESYGQIYPMLKQLTEQGMATSHTEKQEGKPESNIYTLTESGKGCLVDWLSEPVEDAPVRIELLLKLFFGQLVPVHTNMEHVQHFQELQQHLLRKYEDIVTSLQQPMEELCNDEVQRTYSLITVRYGILHTQAYLIWCEETLQTLQILLEKSLNRDSI